MGTRIDCARTYVEWVCGRTRGGSGYGALLSHGLSLGNRIAHTLTASVLAVAAAVVTNACDAVGLGCTEGDSDDQ